jgi:hypothetical protein
MAEFMAFLVLIFSPMSIAPWHPGDLPDFPPDDSGEPQPPRDPCVTGEITAYDPGCGTA